MKGPLGNLYSGRSELARASFVLRRCRCRLCLAVEVREVTSFCPPSEISHCLHDDRFGSRSIALIFVSVPGAFRSVWCPQPCHRRDY